MAGGYAYTQDRGRNGLVHDVGRDREQEQSIRVGSQDLGPQQPAPLVRRADGQRKKADGPWNDLGAGI